VPQPPAAREPAPVSGVPPAAPPRKGRLRDRRVRLWLAMGLGIVVLLCLGGVGVFVSLYDNATAIKRTAPDAVADSFLRAYLVDRDDQEASLYMCKAGGDFAQLTAYRADIVGRERQYSITIQVTWEGLKVATSGDKGTVDVNLTRSIVNSEQISDLWRLAVVDQDGWRVCGATKVS
jgi:hypothetical protein